MSKLTKFNDAALTAKKQDNTQGGTFGWGSLFSSFGSYGSYGSYGSSSYDSYGSTGYSSNGADGADGQSYSYTSTSYHQPSYNTGWYYNYSTCCWCKW